MIADGQLALKEMRRLDDAIDDEVISGQIRQLEELSKKIFEVVQQKPENLPQIRKFMGYYLPTTLKLLNAYHRMDSQGVSGGNIGGTMERVENIMGTIVTAFERQLDALFGSPGYFHGHHRVGEHDGPGGPGGGRRSPHRK